MELLHLFCMLYTVRDFHLTQFSLSVGHPPPLSLDVFSSPFAGHHSHYATHHLAELSESSHVEPCLSPHYRLLHNFYGDYFKTGLLCSTAGKTGLLCSTAGKTRLLCTKAAKTRLLCTKAGKTSLLCSTACQENGFQCCGGTFNQCIVLNHFHCKLITIKRMEQNMSSSVSPSDILLCTWY